MAELKAIIFDMDGTLADTEEIHRQAFNQTFSEFGFDWQWSKEEYKFLLSISGGKERIRSYLKEKQAAVDEHEALWRLAETMHQRKSGIYREKLAGDHIRLRRGVGRLISEAKNENIALAIATSSSRENLETLLHTTLGDQAISWFDAIVTCDIVEDKKPSPAAYQLALAELGEKPQDCIAIEDTRNGNLAALAAGLKTVITTHYFTVDDDFAGASLVLDHLGEPGQPFSVRAGDAPGAGYVDIPLLQSILSTEHSFETDTAWNPEIAFAVK
ncbi:MAG: HAD-IA family hydrolase [Gammaproteobacteria bacterium]